MHLAGSRTIDGLDDVHGVPACGSPAKRRWRTPSSSASVCSSQLPLRDAVEAVVGVVGQQQLDDRLAGVDRARRVGPDLHARGHREGAARHEAALALDLDHAHAAGAARRQAVEVAERGDRDARAPQRRQERLAVLRVDRSAVDFDRDHSVSVRRSAVDGRLARCPLSAWTPVVHCQPSRRHGVEVADVHAGAAADALLRDDVVRALRACRRSPRPGTSSRTACSPCTCPRRSCR